MENQILKIECFIVTMYIYTSLKDKKMKRTQIYIDEDLFEILKMQSKLKNKRISNLIRETLREKYFKKREKIGFLNNAAGIWKNRRFDTEKYIRTLRTDNRLKEFYEE